MKNLFKNLMLVAVAAMAFTACSQDVNDVNGVEKKYTISGVATIENEDTRSGFVGKNEAGDAYVSEWDGGEYIRLYYSAGWSDYTEIDAEGNFEVEYIGDFPAGTTATVCSPDDAWYNVNEYVFPDTQTPRENSVDPMAHILKSDATEIINGTLSVKMKHAVAYGNVSFPELSLDGDAVKNVVLDIDGAEYTINTSATQNIWFACEPNGTVSNMTVTVNTKGGQALYKKIIENGNKNLSFDKGIVSTFNVKGLLQKPSAKATLVTDTTFNDFNPYDVTFGFENGDKVVVRFNTSGNQYLHLGAWQSNNWQDPHYISQATYNGGNAAITACNVAHENDAYIVTMSVYKYTNYTTTEYTYTGAIEGLIAPEACDCLKEPEEVELPEFVIPGEDVAYDLDYRYTKLVSGLDAKNAVRVAQDNSYIWDLKFNPGLSSIEAGDYTAVESCDGYSSTDLVVDTYNGGIQFGLPYDFFYADVYANVTINVQKEGDYYCITLIGSSGYDCPVSGQYRLVYIGKLK